MSILETKGLVKRFGPTVALDGMTLAVEPMINIGRPGVRWLDDEWTVVTEDGSLSAHYENTILVGEDGPEILSLLPSDEA